MGIEELVEATLAGLGYELVEFRRFAARNKVSVFVDSDAGITLSDCELVTHQLEGLFAAEGYDYATLEVSSPGPKRKLRKLEHFRRFSGSTVKVLIKDAKEGGRRSFSGVYRLSEDGRSISLECEDGLHVLPIDAISQAKLGGLPSGRPA